VSASSDEAFVLQVLEALEQTMIDSLQRPPEQLDNIHQPMHVGNVSLFWPHGLCVLIEMSQPQFAGSNFVSDIHEPFQRQFKRMSLKVRNRKNNFVQSPGFGRAIKAISGGQEIRKCVVGTRPFATNSSNRMTIRQQPFMANYEYVAIHGRNRFCWHHLALIVMRRCENQLKSMRSPTDVAS
jgi:hypothetical protein